MSLYDRTTVDGVPLTDDQRSDLSRVAIDYAAAVSTYNDIDERITISAREYAERPSYAWSDTGTGEEAFELVERRECAITDLAQAKAKFRETYERIIGARVA